MEEKPKLKDEIKKMEYEPMLPVEVALVKWSIGLGVVLLALLMLIHRIYFVGE
ncbi:MAG: hypothetical protein OEZ32_03640 [Nitrospinota bacterium]|nr:hypothetical protein [Nitrospinota bacterium]